jgi:hypothetical protein
MAAGIVSFVGDEPSRMGFGVCLVFEVLFVLYTHTIALNIIAFL